MWAVCQREREREREREGKCALSCGRFFFVEPWPITIAIVLRLTSSPWMLVEIIGALQLSRNRFKDERKGNECVDMRGFDLVTNWNFKECSFFFNEYKISLFERERRVWIRFETGRRIRKKVCAQLIPKKVTVHQRSYYSIIEGKRIIEEENL